MRFKDFIELAAIQGQLEGSLMIVDSKHDMNREGLAEMLKEIVAKIRDMRSFYNNDINKLDYPKTLKPVISAVEQREQHVCKFKQTSDKSAKRTISKRISR